MINQCMTLLVQELEGEGIPSPLLCEFTLAAIWDDLARLAGETPPLTVQRLYDDSQAVKEAPTQSPITDAPSPAVFTSRTTADLQSWPIE
jgi:hypothetical protein